MAITTLVASAVNAASILSRISRLRMQASCDADWAAHGIAPEVGFQRARRALRDALAAQGLFAEMDQSVNAILGVTGRDRVPSLSPPLA